MIQLVGAVLLGFLGGAAINYLADRLPYDRRLGSPICVNCQQPVRWVDFAFLRRCPNCSRKPSFRKLLVLLGMPVVTVLLRFYSPERLGFWVAASLLLYLALVAVIDLEHKVVLHPVSIAGALLGLAIGVKLHGPWMTLLGGLAGFGIMLLLYILGEFFTRWVSRIRKQEIDEVALGFGDVNLAGVLGLILGWPGITIGLIFGILLGGLLSGLLVLFLVITRRYQMMIAVPYTPFLILGALLLLFRP